MQIVKAYREFTIQFKNENQARRHINMKVKNQGFWVSEITSIPGANMEDPNAYKFEIVVRKPLFDYPTGW